MLKEIPDFLIELSKQMNTNPNRCTAHPFWQVRHKDYIATAEGYNEHHFEIYYDQERIYRSDSSDTSDLKNILLEEYKEEIDDFLNYYGCKIDDVNCYKNDLPSEFDLIFVQEVEKIVWTGLTEQAANQFIARKQHDYPKLYTYVESAYWSPQLVELQDWIKSLTDKGN